MPHHEKPSADALLKAFEKVIELWAKEANEAADRGVEPNRFEYLGQMVKNKHGDGGFMAWSMIMYGCAWACFFQGKISKENFLAFKETFEPWVEELLEKPDTTH